MTLFNILLTTIISSINCKAVSCNFGGPFPFNESQNCDAYINELVNSQSIQSCATVTVFVHGLGGSYLDFLSINDNQNGYHLCQDSPLDFVANNPYRIDAITNDWLLPSSNYYIFGPKINNGEFNGEFRCAKLYEQYSFNMAVNIEPNEINIFEPIVLLYDDFVDSIIMDEYYSIFIDSLNYVISGIAVRQNNTLPKINLVGHSKGGLACVKYSSIYPGIVQNIVTVGTPLCSSTYASTFSNLNILLGNGNSLDGYGVVDMLNINNCVDLAFNFNCQTLHSMAIGFKQTRSFLADTLQSLIPALLAENIYAENVCYWITNDMVLAIIDVLTRMVYGTFTGDIFGALGIPHNAPSLLFNTILELIELLVSDASVEYSEAVFETDVCVDFNSSIGVYHNARLYNFSNVYSITLGNNQITYPCFDLEHCSEPWNPWVAHNFETKNHDVASLLVSDFNSNMGFHKHNFVDLYNDYYHYKMCLCGASIEMSTHDVHCNYLNSDLHINNCSECDFYSYSQHNFEYTELPSQQHLKKCVECHFEILENHIYNIYRPSTITKHDVLCECGKLKTRESHTYLYNSLTCYKCGQANGIGGGPIVTPPFA